MAKKMKEAIERVERLRGDERIMFAGTAWRVNAVSELANGCTRLVAVYGIRRLVADIPSGTKIEVLVEE